MFSRISGSFYRTAAWRLALRSTIVFAGSSALVFLMMYGLVARIIRDRSDSWLIGESETLKQVALTTPKDSLYRRIVGEVAELGTQEFAFDEGQSLRCREYRVLLRRGRSRGAAALGRTGAKPDAHRKSAKVENLAIDSPFP